MSRATTASSSSEQLSVAAKKCERKSLERMFREYEMTEDDALAEFRDLISILHSYMETWPADRAAADPNNDDYL